jgi:hypothetical protein
MKQRIRHRKLFYVPGMISLLLIPVLCLWHLYAQKSFDKEGSMDLGLPDKGSMEQMKKDYPLIEQRNYIVFTFNGSLEAENETLTKFQKSLKRFNHIKDTINGIKLCFGKQMKYEVFIRILEIVSIEMTPTYLLFGQELIVVNASKSDIERHSKQIKEKYDSSKQMNCGTQEAMYQKRLFDEEQKKLIDDEKIHKAFFKQHWYLFLAYFGIVILNFYALIKFNKNRNYNQKLYL